MEIKQTMEVEFEVMGLSCRQCTKSIHSNIELELEPFMLEHKEHMGFLMIARIIAPAELLSDQLVELEFIKNESD